MSLANSWPYWYARTLKQINKLGQTILYDVDLDTFVTLELAERLIENEGGEDESEHMISMDNLFFGLKDTISDIFESIRAKKIPIPSSTIQNIIREHEEEDPTLKTLRKVKIGDERSSRASVDKDYITNTDRIMKILRENTDNSKCFNLISGNLVNKTGPVIYNENEHIPLCLPKGYKRSDEIFREIESRIEQAYEVGRKTVLISDEKAKEIGLSTIIPKSFTADVKRDITIPLPEKSDVANIMKRFATILEK